MAFRRGDRVHQQAYGPGQIVEVNARYITIAFDDGTTRKFAAARVELGRAAQARPVLPVPAPAAAPRRVRRRAEPGPGGIRS